MYIPEQIEEIIEKEFLQQIDESEHRRLEEWLQEDESHRKAYRERVKVFYLGKYAYKWNAVIPERAWMGIEGRYAVIGRRSRLGRWFAAAASVVVLIGTMIFLSIEKDNPTPLQTTQSIHPGEFKATLRLSDGQQISLGTGQLLPIEESGIRIEHDGKQLNYLADSTKALEENTFNELIIPIGGEYVLQLSDGTMVHLNSESRLRYPVRFPADRREVELEGEAYFEVSENKSAPFIVSTEKLDVRVLGTGFNVMAYRDDTRTEVTLVEGLVNIRVGDKCQLLKPEQQLVFDHQSMQHEVKTVDVGHYVDWKRGILNFNGMSLKELCAKLGRWYNVQFHFKDEACKELRFSGAFKKYEAIDYILALIGETANVNFKIENNETILVFE